MRGTSAVTAATARELVAQVSSSVAVTAVTTASDAVAEATKQPAVRMPLLSWFGAASLLLAAIGVYGLVSQGISLRMREIGIRLALGASARDILWRIAGRALAIAAIGSIVGACVALLFATTLRAVLFGVSLSDASSFIYAVMLLLTVTAIAALIPATKALRVSLTDVLRRSY